jgi:hypothetical protein
MDGSWLLQRTFDSKKLFKNLNSGTGTSSSEKQNGEASLKKL